MGDRGEDMQQMTKVRIRTRVAALRTEPIWYTFCTQSHPMVGCLFLLCEWITGSPFIFFLSCFFSSSRIFLSAP